MTDNQYYANRQRHIFDNDNLIAYAYRTRKYFINCKHAIDIGCGIGYQFKQIALLNSHCHFDLLDKTGDEASTGYTLNGYTHNDLTLTREYTQNLNCTVHNVDEYNWNRSADIVYSTLSWGWHYPVELYLASVLAAEPKYIIFDNRLQDVVDIKNYKLVDSFRINRKELTQVYELIL